MSTRLRRRAGAAVIAGFAVFVGVLAVFWQPVAKAAIVTGLAGTTGLHLSFSHFEVHHDRLLAYGVHVENDARETIADVASIKLQYSLRDLLPGSSRMFGLAGFDIEDAHLIVIRHPDGTLNVPLPKQFASAPPSSTPYVFKGRLRDASIDVYDRAQGVPAARHLVVQGINANLDVATNARSRYRIALTYVENGQRFPLKGSGDINVPAGIGLQRWWSRRLPIARIADVALNSPSFHMAGGSLENLDARIVGFAGRDGALKEHVSATATIERARIAIGGLAKPLRNVNGAIAVYGNGLLLQNVHATIAGVPIQLGGGVFNLASPQFRLTVDGRGDFRDFRTALAQTNPLRLTGAAQLNVLVEGAPSKPLTLIAVRSPRANYGLLPFDRPNGLIAFDGQEVDVLDLHTRYGRIDLRARGRFSLQPKPNAVEMIAGFEAPPDSLPYVNALVPGMPIDGTILASGNRLNLIDTRGVIAGDGGRRLTATFHVASNGVGTVGPLQIDAPKASLYAIAALDRPHGRLDAYVDARKLRLATGRNPWLPGMHVSSLPPVAATVDARVAGSLRNGRAQVAGFANLRNVQTPMANVNQAHVEFGRTAQSSLAVAIDASGIGAIGAVATAMASYENGTIHVNDIAAASRGTFADVRGDVTGVRTGIPRYDLRANVHSVDLASLAATAKPRSSGLIEGSLEAQLRLSGSGSTPELDGAVQVPEGTVNGLAFDGLNTSLRGTPSFLALRNGNVEIGSTAVAFDAAIGASSERIDVSAPNADLADFNDFFDAGDVLGGRGRVRAGVALAGGTVVATSGEIALHDAKVRGFDIGAAQASWSGSGDRIGTSLAFNGESGRVWAAGSVSLSGGMALTAHARDVNLSRWLPMAGIAAPVTGIAQADISAAGRYPYLNARVNAQVTHGSVGRLPVSRFTVVATANNGRGQLRRASIETPNARITGSGSFGLRANDPLGLAFHAATPDVIALADTITGRKIDAAGSLDTTLHVGGTLKHPAFNDDFVLSRARFGRFVVPRAAGRIYADEHAIAVRSGEIDLSKGRLLVEGTLPIQLIPFQLDPRDRPVGASIVADDVEASNVADLLPKGTTVGGRVDGRLGLSGTVRSPRLLGSLVLAKGYFAGPQERVPITDATATLTLRGTEARLQDVHATAGGGTIDADGSASIPSVRDANSIALALNVHARNARLDLPQYIKGRFNGDLALTRVQGSRPAMRGTVSVDSARIPMTALYNPKPASAPQVALPDLAMDLHVFVNRDVRVVSPNVDVGTQGSVRVLGTLAAPSLAGQFTSTGGTVSFFRDFQVQDATVSFDPAGGLVPDVDATATTFVTNPDTNVGLRVTGPADHLNVAFASDPPYDREQILGLLVNAQSVGAVHGVASTGSSPFSASSAVSGLAASQLNTIFTRNLLEPLSVAAGGTLGLENLQITNDVQRGLGVNAVKAFGRYVSFVFADTFNEPRRQSWSLRAHQSDRTQFELTAYSSQETLLGYEPLLVQGLAMGSVATIPLDTGANGVNLKVQRTFP